MLTQKITPVKPWWEEITGTFADDPAFEEAEEQTRGWLGYISKSRTPAWEGNWTWDCFIAFAWQGTDGQRAIAAVNYAGHKSQCYIPLPWSTLGGQMYQLKDLMGAESCERSGNSLLSPLLYLDLPAWGYQVFELIPLG